MVKPVEKSALRICLKARSCKRSTPNIMQRGVINLWLYVAGTSRTPKLQEQIQCSIQPITKGRRYSRLQRAKYYESHVLLRLPGETVGWGYLITHHLFDGKTTPDQTIRRGPLAAPSPFCTRPRQT